MLQSFHYKQPFLLESGRVLPALEIAYHTYGKLNETADNVVWICHALTASADAADWWPGMIGSGLAIDPNRHFIVCANILGSCYGTTGPLSIHPETGKAYLHDFPLLTIRDMVQAHMLLRHHLGIRKIQLMAGGSMGGYQALEWSLMEPRAIDRLFLIATSAAESAWGISIHTAQRLAIAADTTWQLNIPEAGIQGLKAARAIGMLTYRSYHMFRQQQTEEDPDKTDDFKASSYMIYQGEKLAKRFNAFSYWILGKAMDSHNIARSRNKSREQLLQQLSIPSLIISISSDQLCPPSEQQFLAAHIPLSQYHEITSDYGHDGFLTEAAKINTLLAGWMQ